MTAGAPLPALIVTTRDWEHPGWEESFYPDDLPDEWRLGYFANSFAAVLVPASRLENLDEETVRGWLEDVNSKFGFYLEQDVGPALRGAFGEQLSGILLESTSSDVRCFKEIVDKSLQNSPNSTILTSSDAEECFCLYRPGPELSLRDLRTDIEELLAVLPAAKRCVLCWDTEPVPVELLENAKVIAELLGA